MEETMLSWAISLYAGILSDKQLAEFIDEKTGVKINWHTIWLWRNGLGYPENDRCRVALANTLGFAKYSTLLFSDTKQVKSLMGSVALKMKIKPSMLRQIELSRSQKLKLLNQMRAAIDLTGDETAAIGVAVAFWTNYFSKKHPILNLKMKLKN